MLTLRRYTLPIMIALGMSAVGLVYVITRRDDLAVSAIAHTSDGQHLFVECRLNQNHQIEDEHIASVLVRNTVCRQIEAQASVQVEGQGIAPSNQVTTEVPCVAGEVVLDLKLNGGVFSSTPRLGDRRPVTHTATKNELIIFLGDMETKEEKMVSVRVRPR